MKATGMVRRVDSLGRIVIPKEIRKVLKIKENEQVEINVSNDEIILNRYSDISDDDLNLQRLIDSINDIYNIDILLTNLNYFTITTKNYLYLKGKEISSYLTNVLNTRNEIKDNNNLLLNIDEKEIKDNFYIKTIIINGDTLGLLIFIGKDINKIDDKLYELTLNYLEKYLE